MRDADHPNKSSDTLPNAKPPTSSRRAAADPYAPPDILPPADLLNITADDNGDDIDWSEVQPETETTVPSSKADNTISKSKNAQHPNPSSTLPPRSVVADPDAFNSPSFKKHQNPDNQNRSNAGPSSHSRRSGASANFNNKNNYNNKNKKNYNNNNYNNNYNNNHTNNNYNTTNNNNHPYHWKKKNKKKDKPSQDFTCLICNVTLTGDANIQDHNRGKNHLAKLRQHNLRNNNASLRGHTLSKSNENLPTIPSSRSAPPSQPPRINQPTQVPPPLPSTLAAPSSSPPVQSTRAAPSPNPSVPIRERQHVNPNLPQRPQHSIQPPHVSAPASVRTSAPGQASIPTAASAPGSQSAPVRPSITPTYNTTKPSQFPVNASSALSSVAAASAAASSVGKLPFPVPSGSRAEAIPVTSRNAHASSTTPVPFARPHLSADPVASSLSGPTAPGTNASTSLPHASASGVTAAQLRTTKASPSFPQDTTLPTDTTSPSFLMKPTKTSAFLCSGDDDTPSPPIPVRDRLLQPPSTSAPLRGSPMQGVTVAALSAQKSSADINSQPSLAPTSTQVPSNASSQKLSAAANVKLTTAVLSNNVPIPSETTSLHSAAKFSLPKHDTNVSQEPRPTTGPVIGKSANFRNTPTNAPSVFTNEKLSLASAKLPSALPTKIPPSLSTKPRTAASPRPAVSAPSPFMRPRSQSVPARRRDSTSRTTVGQVTTGAGPSMSAAVTPKVNPSTAPSSNVDNKILQASVRADSNTIARHVVTDSHIRSSQNISRSPAMASASPILQKNVGSQANARSGERTGIISSTTPLSQNPSIGRKDVPFSSTATASKAGPSLSNSVAGKGGPALPSSTTRVERKAGQTGGAAGIISGTSTSNVQASQATNDRKRKRADDSDSGSNRQVALNSADMQWNGANVGGNVETEEQRMPASSKRRTEHPADQGGVVHAHALPATGLRTAPTPGPALRAIPPPGPALRAVPPPGPALRAVPPGPALRTVPLGPAGESAPVPPGPTPRPSESGEIDVAARAAADQNLFPGAVKVPMDWLSQSMSISEWREIRWGVFKGGGTDVDQLAYKMAQEILLSPVLGIGVDSLKPLAQALAPAVGNQYAVPGDGIFARHSDLMRLLVGAGSSDISHEQRMALNLFMENVEYTFKTYDHTEKPQELSLPQQFPARGSFGMKKELMANAPSMMTEDGLDKRYADSVENDNLYESLFLYLAHRGVG